MPRHRHRKRPLMDNQIQLMRERGERLRQAARTIGITHAAKAAGVPYTTLRDYMNGGEMKFSSVAALARVCGVSLDWLAYGVGTPPASSSPLGSDAPPRGGHQAVIPWLDNRDEGLRISRTWLEKTFQQDGTSLRLLTVTGDAMSPTLQEDDLLIVDTSHQHVQGGSLYALAIEDAILIRRLERRLGGGLRALADNERYPAQEVSAEEASQINVIGEIVWSGGSPRG